MPSLLIYADPGSGMLIWQLITAGLIGAMFYGRTLLRKLGLMKVAPPETNDKNQQSSQIPPPPSPE